MAQIVGIQGLPVSMPETIGVQVSGSGQDGKTHSIRVRAYQGSVVVMDRTHPVDQDIPISIDPNVANTFTLGGTAHDPDLWLSDETRRPNPADVLVELIQEGKGQKPDVVVQQWPMFTAGGYTG